MKIMQFFIILIKIAKIVSNSIKKFELFQSMPNALKMIYANIQPPPHTYIAHTTLCEVSISA